MLARYGEEAVEPLESIEQRVERHLASLLAGWPSVPMPSLRLIQAPVFHGHSFSVWVEFEEQPGVKVISEALAAGGIDVRSEEPPSNIGAAGQSGLSVGAIAVDANNPRACWFWAVADNLRLAAEIRGRGRAGETMSRLVALLRFFWPLAVTIPPGTPACCRRPSTRIAIPAFLNASNRYKLTDQLPEAIKREFIARTKYKFVSDPNGPMPS